jgi:integrase/recombinase XerD
VTYPDSGHLFLSIYGSPFRRDVLGAIIKKHLKNAGIDKPGSCHLFRHACATHMLDNGADIRFIQALLGHTQLNTTEIYTRVRIDKLKQIHAATHPATMQTKTDDEGNERLQLLTTLAQEADDEDGEITRH